MDNRNIIESPDNSIEMKQMFLSNAISDIASYIQLLDTKISIIMGALVALMAGILACYDPIIKAFMKINPCSWLGISTFILCFVCLISLIIVFLCGILTIRGHSSNISYNSKWYLGQSKLEYSFEEYKKDVMSMTQRDILENMAAELFKLNDIFRQKARTMKWALRAFSTSLIILPIIGALLLSTTM